MTATSRELDLVVFGATGFTGRLTALHLAEHAPGEVRIALAGRSRERLEAVRAGLPGAAADWPLLVADAADEEAVADLAARARVVATTVGPYLRYGRALAAACARAGTHYCDLTGEVLFIRRSIDENHEAALESGARIVHACGVDSVPSDLAVLLCAEAVQAGGSEPGETALAVRSFRGGASGGTIDTMRQMAVSATTDAGARRKMLDPYLLVDGPRPERRPSSRPRRGGLAGALDRVSRAVPVRRDAENGRFTGPFVMASFNTRVVARTASLLGYGDRFRYREFADFGTGVRGAVAAGVASGALVGLVAGMAFGPSRAVLDRVLPAPGEGPSEETMAAGRFRMVVTMEATDGHRVRTTVAAPYDPGYRGSAIMLGQSALALALDTDRLPEASGGVLTPASAIGHPLVDRLREHGFTLETEQPGAQAPPPR